MSRQVALTLVLLSLTTTAHAQDDDTEPGVVCHCHAELEHDHGNCDDVKALQHRVDHQIDQVDDLIEMLNKTHVAIEDTAVPLPAPLIDVEELPEVGPPFMVEEIETAAPELELDAEDAEDGDPS